MIALVLRSVVVFALSTAIRFLRWLYSALNVTTAKVLGGLSGVLYYALLRVGGERAMVDLFNAQFAGRFRMVRRDELADQLAALATTVGTTFADPTQRN
jgi:hypothetical protein